MSDELVKHIKDRGDWLVDAVATATQNRQFLRGEPECDDVACEAIRMNGEMAMRQIAKPLEDRIEELEAKLAKAADYVWDTLTDYIETRPRDGRTAENTFSDYLKAEQLSFIEGLRVARLKARTTLAELRSNTTGGKDE